MFNFEFLIFNGLFVFGVKEGFVVSNLFILDSEESFSRSVAGFSISRKGA